MGNSGDRRAFLLHGGVGLGALASAASLAAAVPAVAATDELEQLRDALACVKDREAVEALQLNFLHAIALSHGQGVGALFHPEGWMKLHGVVATGGEAVEALFTDAAAGRTSHPWHRLYRTVPMRQLSGVKFGADANQASANYAVEALLCVPLEGDCTAAQMARQQGQHLADTRREHGTLVATYIKNNGDWQIGSMEYQPLSWYGDLVADDRDAGDLGLP